MSPIFDAPVVCNAGPLIGLARVNLAWLPFRLFPEAIQAVKPCLDGMIQGGYFLGPNLVSSCLDAAGES